MRKLARSLLAVGSIPPAWYVLFEFCRVVGIAFIVTFGIDRRHSRQVSGRTASFFHTASQKESLLSGGDRFERPFAPNSHEGTDAAAAELATSVKESAT